MASPWTWDDRSKRYRNVNTGRYIGSKQMVDLRDAFIEAQKETSRKLATQLAKGDIDMGRWLADSRKTIKTTFVDEYCLAHGGRGTMTQADWGRVGAMVKKQYGYFQKFAEDVQDGISEARLVQRAQMYVDAGTQAFERGRSESLGIPQLTQYPGDGQTRCLTNCKCHLEYEQRDDGVWEVTWSLGVAEHCPDCVSLSQRWNPLVVA